MIRTAIKSCYSRSKIHLRRLVSSGRFTAALTGINPATRRSQCRKIEIRCLRWRRRPSCQRHSLRLPSNARDRATPERGRLDRGADPTPAGPARARRTRVAVLDQAIAWSDGLKLRGYMIDRWRGRENQRLREIEITVTGRGSVEIGGRRVETFVVTQRPIDGGFHWLRQITVERPHRDVHSRYYPAGLKEGARPFVSEVSALLQDASCTKTE